MRVVFLELILSFCFVFRTRSQSRDILTRIRNVYGTDVRKTDLEKVGLRRRGKEGGRSRDILCNVSVAFLVWSLLWVIALLDFFFVFEIAIEIDCNNITVVSRFTCRRCRP